ncbi:SdrD B-like domain-containing protein [Aurantimicrobium sp. INA4]|uniref:Ig-like domain-containing protein n=1 Tax=Aurantimicrobium sp. INA4 TaxID=2986279 RepID=UPI00249258DF|nr:SdrD B-like domain-containing protein [Aurantimicrobium sp. INA4]
MASGANTAQAVDAVTLSVSATSVAPGSTVDLTASMPVVSAGSTTQTLTQTIDPTKVKLTSVNDITYPAGWTLSFSTDGTTFTTTAPTTTNGWASVVAVRASGPINSNGADGNGYQIATGTATGSAVSLTPASIPSSGVSGTDGYQAFFDAGRTRVFNLFHHSVGATLDCHVIATGSTCVGFPFNYGGSTEEAAHGVVVGNTIWAASLSGFYCIDISAVLANTGNTVGGGSPARCFGASALVPGTSSLPLVYFTGASQLGQAEETKLYALRTNAVSGAQVYCIDTATRALCSVPTLDTMISKGAQADGDVELIGQNLYVFVSTDTGQNTVNCINVVSGNRCAGWNSNFLAQSSGAYWNQMGKFAQIPNAQGILRGICYLRNETNITWTDQLWADQPCWNLDGSTFTPGSINLPRLSPGIFRTYGSPVVLGSRLYMSNGNTGTNLGEILCYDAAANNGMGGRCNGAASNAAFLPPSLAENYTVTPDPLIQDCIWVARHTDPVLKTFNILTGQSGCSALSPTTATFAGNVIVPRMSCSSGSQQVRSWVSFMLSSAGSGSFTSAKLTIKNSSNTVIAGWVDVPLSLNSPLDLSSLSTVDTGTTPTFSVAFNGITGSITTATAVLKAVGDAPELCTRVTAVYPCPSGLGPMSSLPDLATTVGAFGTSVLGGVTTTLTSASRNLTVQAPSLGFCTTSISGRAGDAGGGTSGTAIPGVTVTLLDSSGNPILSNGSPVTTTTASDGTYTFANLLPNSYRVSFNSPSGKTLVSSTTSSGAAGTTVGASSNLTAICPGGGTGTTLQSNFRTISGSSVLDRTTPTNLVQNGDFTTANTPGDHMYLFGTVGGTRTVNGVTAPIGTIPNWTITGGGTDTYAFWSKNLDYAPIASIRTTTSAGNNQNLVYFGNEAGASVTPAVTYNADGWSAGTHTLTTSGPAYGTGSNPPQLSQTISTVAGKTYRLQFLQAYENYGSLAGIAALDISGYSRSYFKVLKAVTRNTIEFVATSSSTTISFLSWGHLPSATELALDDVIVNECAPAPSTLNSPLAATVVGTNAVVNALYSLPAAAGSDLSSGAWDSNQTISPLTNDNASSGATLTASSVKVCTTSTSTGSCTGTTLTVPGEGTYTANANGTVTFDPLPTFSGTATPVKYVVSDSASNVVSSTITASVSAPAPSSASADSTSGLKGATQTVTPQSNDTPGAGITFVNSSVKLCAVGILPPNCSATSLTNAAGTYSVNATTGVITFTPDASFSGVAPALTYQVSDTSGQTVSSTYTATVTGVPTTDNESTSGAWNQPQSVSLITGDVAGYGTTLTSSSVKLCGPSDTAPNCSQTSLTVAGVGTYVVDSTGSVTFTPLASFTGTAAAVTYSVTDSLNQKATGTYTAAVTPPAAPAASSEQKAVLPGGTVSFTATVSGSSPLATGTQLKTGASGGPQFVCPVTGASSCSATSVVVTGEGTWTMNQTTGVATFIASNSATPGTLTAVTYRVTDVTGQTAIATLTPIVPPAPTAAADASRGAVDATQFVAVLGNDAPGAAVAGLVGSTVKLCDVNQSAPSCTLTSKTVAGEGTYTVLANGVVKFVPVSGYHGTATTVNYQVQDALGQTANSTLQVVVVPPPFPLATIDTGSAAYGQTVTLKPLLNDAPGVVPSGETAPAPNIVAASLRLCGAGQSAPTCSATSVTTADGTYVLNASTGEVVFTPATGFSGTVTSPVTYQVSNDWTGLSGPGTATSVLLPTIAPPGSPVAVADTRETSPMTPVTLSPVTNDVNGTGTLVPASLRLCSSSEIAPACTQTTVTVNEGVFTVNTSTGDVTFTPNSSFDATHPAQVAYAIQDSLNLWTHATITITDPPLAPLSQVANLAQTGMNFFGGPGPFSVLVSLVAGVTLVAYAKYSRLKPGTHMLKIEYSDSYVKLMDTLAGTAVPATREPDVYEDKDVPQTYRYVDGRPD